MTSIRCLPSIRVGVPPRYCRKRYMHVVADASEAAGWLMDRFQDRTVVKKQTLDGNQLQRLCITLGRGSVYPGLDVTSASPPVGSPVPPGYHLVYFTPADLESALGADGTDQTHNAPMPFSRRMWAGGEMTWDTDLRLRVGDEVEEHTTLLGAIPKRSRNGDEMVLVDVHKEFWTKQGLALVDKRSWIFRAPPTSGSLQAAVAQQEVEETPRPVYDTSVIVDIPTIKGHYPKRQLRWSPVALFRFSALTFNAHMIHYNETWTKEVEGHPHVVVHGPLNLINMLDYWRDHHSRDSRIRSITYRALSPIYAGESYVIETVPETSATGYERTAMDLLISKAGVVCMKGTITLIP